jgi:hypothetical protein
MQWRLRKSIGAQYADEFGVETGIPLEPAIQVVAEILVMMELFDQFENNSRSATPDRLALPLPAQSDIWWCPISNIDPAGAGVRRQIPSS